MMRVTLLALMQVGAWPVLGASLGVGYLGLGVGFARHLSRRGYPLSVSASALACWPLFLGLSRRTPPTSATSLAGGTHGPNEDGIQACVAALRESLELELVDELGDRERALIDREQLSSLVDALRRADLRIARVDQLLDQARRQGEVLAVSGATPELDAALSSLARARDHAQAELGGVLAGLVQLRVQLGLFTLAGEGDRVRERLAQFEARVAALAELSSIELDPVRP